jgi:hypothetical protein
VEVKGLPKGAVFEDGKLKVDIKSEKLVSGYNLELLATCSESPQVVTRSINFPLNILTAIKEKAEAADANATSAAVKFGLALEKKVKDKEAAKAAAGKLQAELDEQRARSTKPVAINKLG